MGWLSGWSYRRAVTITNNTSTELTDYQVRIELDSSNFDFSKANADGSDIRFTADDGETLLAYYIEKWDSSNQQAAIWVKVPSIPANGSATIYMYYGNPSAASESNGESVFEFFDDFEGDSLDASKWDYQNVAVENGILKSTADNGLITSKTAPVPAEGGAIVEARVMLNADYDTDLRLIYDSNNYIYLRYSTYASGNYNGHSQLQKVVGGSVSVIAYSVGPQTVKGEWALLRLTKKDGTTYIAYVKNSAGEGSYTATISDSVFVNNDLKVGWYGQHANDYIDWVRVRKYAEQEPSLSVGSEETPPIPVKVWDGSSWVDVKAVKVWDGSSWVNAKAIYYWDGSSWVKIYG